jgi:hypothetical protein
LYACLLRLYPRSFVAEFGDEMRAVFEEMVARAARHGFFVLAGAILRELLGAPLALLRAHWFSWKKGATGGVSPWFSSMLSPSLPPPPPDGRASWVQAGLEVSLFLSMGAILVLQTYCSLALPILGSLRGPGNGGTIFLLPISLFTIGLVRGLPRWAYPYGGMLLGYSLAAAIRFRQLPFLVASLLAFAALTAAAVIVHSRGRPLPIGLRRLGRSIVVDWTRLSFCIYGAMPLTIAAAFDNAYLDNRTPYLAVGVLLMVAGGLVYARSRRTARQSIALLGGTSLCFLCALLDHVHFVGSWIAESGWLIQLWASVSATMLVPILIGLAQRALAPGRAA